MTKAPHLSKEYKSYTLSIRLTAEEHARLDRLSAGMSYSDYVRGCLFGENTTKRRRRNKHPVKDHALISKVIAKLGSSRLASNLNQIAHAANCGALLLNPQVQDVIVQACADIREIKAMLIKALGLGL